MFKIVYEYIYCVFLAVRQNMQHIFCLHFKFVFTHEKLLLHNNAKAFLNEHKILINIVRNK